MRSVQISLSLTSLCLISLRFTAYSVAVAAALAPISTALAQDANKVGGGLQIAQVSGTMQAMAQNQVKIAAEDKKEYFIVLTEQTSLQYRGTADPDFLMPGLLVRFSAELTQSGGVETPVAELEVFTFSQSRRMTPEQMREQTPGVYQVGGEVGNAKKPGAKETPKQTTAPAQANAKTQANAKASTKGQTKQGSGSSAGAQPYRVVAQVVGVQAGKVFVQAGSVRIQFELAPKAVINVAARDTTFMQIGDQVKVSGLRNAAQEQYIQAETVEIVAAKPLGPAEGKAGAKNAKASKTKGKGAKPGSSKDDTEDDKKPGASKTDAKKTDPPKKSTP